MRPKKDKQAKGSEVLASTLDRGYMLRALLARDARSERLASLILQRYGYCLREQERGEAEIVAEIEMLHDALSSDYGVPLPLIPTEDEVAEIHQDIIGDVESGSAWLLSAEEEILALFDTALPELTAHIRQALSTQQLPDSLEADGLNPTASFNSLSGCSVLAVSVIYRSWFTSETL